MGGALKKYADWLMALGVIGLMVTLITPMPPWILDLLLALNLTSAVLLLMLTMGVFGAILVFTALLVRYLVEGPGGILLLAILLIGQVAGAAVWLRYVSRHWETQ